VTPPETPVPLFLPRDRLQDLVDALRRSGRRTLGPRVRDGAIVYDSLTSVAELPTGVRDVQLPGRYVLEHSESGRQFAWATGPQALKPLLFAPRESLWRVVRGDDGRLEFREVLPDVEPLAVVGVRACDLAALALQDQHFLQGPYRDPYYARRREQLFLVAVGCSHPAATCFCASTGDGPRPRHSFDILLEELDAGYVAHAGSSQGGDLLAALRLTSASDEQLRIVCDESARAAAVQTRKLPSNNLRAALFANLDHERWDDVAQRCLSCGNCTSVCPTCFCHSEQDAPALSGHESEHLREWDSCFTRGHSYLHGFTVRADTRSRYRQWLTHKLGSWHDQYGRSGCVGCGRCIAWCPVGIDITDEAAAICGQST
jgi:ferredoxin